VVRVRLYFQLCLTPALWAVLSSLKSHSYKAICSYETGVQITDSGRASVFGCLAAEIADCTVNVAYVTRVRGVVSGWLVLLLQRLLLVCRDSCYTDPSSPWSGWSVDRTARAKTAHLMGLMRWSTSASRVDAPLLRHAARCSLLRVHVADLPYYGTAKWYAKT
jgi:hypothetical protein